MSYHLFPKIYILCLNYLFMRPLFVLGLTTLLLKISSAQCDTSYFRNTGTLINDLLLIDSNKVVAVGDNGYAIKSTDGGKSWRNIPTFQPYFLRAVCAATDSVLYAVGSYQTILKSEDQGESWFPLYVKLKTPGINVTDWFNDVFFLNKNKGFIVADGGLLISTNDGGRSWKDTVFTTFLSGRLNSVTFVNDTLGFISGGSNFLYRTKNGGATWEKIDVDAIGFNMDITKVKFINALKGFAVGGGGLVMKTTDGGNTWTGGSTPNPNSYVDLCFINSQVGFIASTNTDGLVTKTTDGGDSWNTEFISVTSGPSYCYSVATDPAGKRVLFGGGSSTGYGGRYILSTTDGGSSYQLLSGNGRSDFYTTYFLNDSTGYIAGDAGFCYKTSDYGESWKPLHIIPSLLANPSSNIFFIDEKYGFVSSDRIYKTTDGGDNWDLVDIPGGEQQVFPRSMYFFDTLTGVVVDYGAIYRTVNAGASWSNVLTSPSTFTDLCFTKSGKGYAVGYDGKFFTSNDKGVTWNSFDLGSTDDLSCVYFYDNNLGFIGTADSMLYKTTNGGSSWTKINIHDPVRMRSIIFINDFTGYLMLHNDGSPSGIKKTKDGGLTWSFVSSTSESLSKFSGFKNIYISGASGFILKTDNPHAPGSPGYIYGPDVNCQNSKSDFITGPLQGVNYAWSLSGGGVNSFKQNKDTVLWSQPGSYTLGVNISNVCGTGPTVQTNIIVHRPTVIDSQPASQTICTGSPLVLSVVASGESIRYQWKKTGDDIPGATGSSYKIDSATEANSGFYSVTVTGLCGAVTSPYAQIDVRPKGSCVTALPAINTFIDRYTLMPSLVTDHAILKIISRRNVKVNWSILDANGRGVIYFNNQLTIGENQLDLSLRRLSTGTYYILGSTNSGIIPPIRFVKTR